MIAANHDPAAEARIRALLDDQAEAIRIKDVEASTAGYAPDILLFDVVGPLRYAGRDAVRQRLAKWFASFEGPIGFERRDLRIRAEGDVAFAHSLNRVNATTRNGGKLDMWWRETVCWRLRGGAWRITHEHASVPFEVVGGTAALGLAPGTGREP